MKHRALRSCVENYGLLPARQSSCMRLFAKFAAGVEGREPGAESRSLTSTGCRANFWKSTSPAGGTRAQGLLLYRSVHRSASIPGQHSPSREDSGVPRGRRRRTQARLAALHQALEQAGAGHGQSARNVATMRMPCASSATLLRSVSLRRAIRPEITTAGVDQPHTHPGRRVRHCTGRCAVAVG